MKFARTRQQLASVSTRKWVNPLSNHHFRLRSPCLAVKRPQKCGERRVDQPKHSKTQSRYSQTTRITCAILLLQAVARLVFQAMCDGVPNVIEAAVNDLLVVLQSYWANRGVYAQLILRPLPYSVLYVQRYRHKVRERVMVYRSIKTRRRICLTEKTHNVS